jgi:hypothetical protein
MHIISGELLFNPGGEQKLLTARMTAFILLIRRIPLKRSLNAK